MPYMKIKGLAFRTAKKISGRMMKAWIDRPANTVAMNRASLRSSPPMSTILATRWAIRLQIPIGAYLEIKKKRKKSHSHTTTRVNLLRHIVLVSTKGVFRADEFMNLNKLNRFRISTGTQTIFFFFHQGIEQGIF